MTGTILANTLRDQLRKLYVASPLRWFGKNRVSRTEVIQRCIDATGAKTYLEIGVSNGANFAAIRVNRKIGVDPIPPAPTVREMLKVGSAQYHEMTSDDFFRSAAAFALPSGVDVAFVDGLHTFEQSYRDCLNSLEHLSPRGLVLLHDCLPVSEAEGRPAASYDEARRLNGESWNGDWTGDVWKAVVALRFKHPDIRTNVLTCDHGLGVVRRGRNPNGASNLNLDVVRLSFDEMARDSRRLLGLRRPAFLQWILLWR